MTSLAPSLHWDFNISTLEVNLEGAPVSSMFYNMCYNENDLTKNKGLYNIKYMVARHFQGDDLLFEPDLNFHDFEISKTQWFLISLRRINPWVISYD